MFDINFNKFRDNHIRHIDVTSMLRQYGIDASYPGFIVFNWEKTPSYVKENVDKEYPFGLTFEERLMLSLAETMEIRNNYLSDDEIIAINKFFETTLTMDEILKFGSKFI